MTLKITADMMERIDRRGTGVDGSRQDGRLLEWSGQGMMMA